MKRSTPLSRTTRLRKVNNTNRKKRQARTAKLRRSPEHQQAIQEARERANGRCEYTEKRANPLYIGSPNDWTYRCTEIEELEAHHVRYDPPRIKILCRRHHHLIESQLRPWNQGRLGR